MLALGGCTGGGKKPEPLASASADPPTTASPTTTRIPSVPTVAKPERPADMDRTDEVGAGAAATYFLSLYSYVMQTGDVTEWDAMTTDACDFCRGIRSDSNAIVTAGGHYSGGKISVTNVNVGSHDASLDAFAVETSITQQASQQTDAVGTAVTHSSDRAGNVRVELINRAEGWGILAVINEST